MMQTFRILLLWILAMPPALAVELVVAEAAWQSVLLTGYTRARARMPLSMEESGRVLEVAADVGELIPPDGRFTCVDSTYVELDLASNQAGQERLNADVAYYRKETRRFEDLMKRKTTSQAEVDRTRHDLDTHRFQLRALEVEEQRLREKLARCCTLAPSGWRVISRSVEPGQWVAVGQQVAEVGDFGTLLVPLALDPAELAALERQDALSVELPDFGRTLPAVVERVSPAFDPVTRKVNVDLAIDPADGGIGGNGGEPPRGGLRVHLTLQLPDATGAVVVPRRALVESYERRFLVREDGSRVAVIELGAAGDDRVKVSSPEAAAGDRFLAAPNP